MRRNCPCSTRKSSRLTIQKNNRFRRRFFHPIFLTIGLMVNIRFIGKIYDSMLIIRIDYFMIVIIFRHINLHPFAIPKPPQMKGCFLQLFCWFDSYPNACLETLDRSDKTPIFTTLQLNVPKIVFTSFFPPYPFPYLDQHMMGIRQNSHKH